MSKENLVAYCGLYCGDCYNYTGSIADLARDLRKELRKNKFKETAKVMPFKEFDNYQECYECLGAMVKLRCKGCRDGFRSKFCKIAKWPRIENIKDVGNVMNFKPARSSTS